MGDGSGGAAGVLLDWEQDRVGQWGKKGGGGGGVLGSLGQSKYRNDIPSTVKHWEDTV